MTTPGTPEGFMEWITNALTQISKSGVFWGAAISAGDPEWRAMAEAFAFWLRERFNIEFTDEEQREYAERIFASTRGSLERVINKKFKREAIITIFEKILIDMPDFAASILFADAEEFAVRRALRARTLVTNGTLTQEEVERAEEAIEPLYDEVASIVTDVAQGGGKPTEMPDANIWKGERFKKLLRESRDITQTMGEIPVHEMAVKLRDRFLELDKAMGDRLMHFFGFNPDPELEKEETAAKDERNRARSRRDQLVAIAKTRDETNKFNAQADAAAGVVQQVIAGLPIDKETLYGRKPKKRRRWGSKM